MCDISLCFRLGRIEVKMMPSGLLGIDSLSSSLASYLCLYFLSLLSQHGCFSMISHVSSLWDKGAFWQLQQF